MNDPFVMLKQDHREAAALLDRLAHSRPGPRRKQTLDKLDAALKLHMRIEERYVYPLVPKLVDQESETEAEIEHGLARDGLAQLRRLVDKPGFGAAVAMVTAGIKHHVKEEEQELFPKMKRKLERDQLGRLGDKVDEAKRRSRTGARKSAAARRAA